MTANELKKLKEESGYGITAIYRVARALKRVPYSWEVVYYAGRRGRRNKYLPGITVERRIAALEWNRLGVLLQEHDVSAACDLTQFFDDFIADIDLTPFTDDVWKMIDKWNTGYGNIEPDALEKLARNALLMIVKELKNIINGD